MQTAGLTIIPTNKPDVMAFEINGVITEKELPPELEKFEKFLNERDSVRMLARFKHFGGFEPAVFTHSMELISVKLAAVKKLERYAAVGAPDWMNKIIHMVSGLFPTMEIRMYPLEEEAEAWDWLEAKEAKTANMS